MEAYSHCMKVAANKKLNTSTKLVYMALCVKAAQVGMSRDERGRYIIYPEYELRQALSLSRNTISTAMNQLKDAGLLQQKKGCGVPARLYLLAFGGYKHEI